MKTKKIIRIVASNPASWAGKRQAEINSLIGKSYEVIDVDKETAEMTIKDDSFGGQIVINPSEYEIVS